MADYEPMADDSSTNNTQHANPKTEWVPVAVYTIILALGITYFGRFTFTFGAAMRMFLLIFGSLIATFVVMALVDKFTMTEKEKELEKRQKEREKEKEISGTSEFNKYTTNILLKIFVLFGTFPLTAMAYLWLQGIIKVYFTSRNYLHLLSFMIILFHVFLIFRTWSEQVDAKKTFCKEHPDYEICSEMREKNEPAQKCMHYLWGDHYIKAINCGEVESDEESMRARARKDMEEISAQFNKAKSKEKQFNIYVSKSLTSCIEAGILKADDDEYLAKYMYDMDDDPEELEKLARLYYSSLQKKCQNRPS